MDGWMDGPSVETDPAHVPASQRKSTNTKQRLKCTWGCEPQQTFLSSPTQDWQLHQTVVISQVSRGAKN